MTDGAVGARSGDDHGSASAADVFTADVAAQALRSAAERVGVDASDAELIRIGSNAVYRLDGSAVARVARTISENQRATTAVGVARWLAAENYPAVRALAVDQPVTAGRCVVKFWESVSDVEEYGTVAEVATLIRRLHLLDRPPPSTLRL
jgi:hypothetical protein